MKYIFKKHIEVYFNIESDIAKLFTIVGTKPFDVEYITAPYVYAAKVAIERGLFLHYCQPYIDDSTLLGMTCDYLGISRDELVERVTTEQTDAANIKKAIKEYEEKYGKKFTIA